MRLKSIPEDFVVRERLDLSRVGSEGPFAIYQVEKRGITTIEAAVRLARAANVKTESVRFAGLKDARACTVQAFSVGGGREAVIDSPELRARLLGYAPEPVHSEWLLSNEFEIRVRDLAAGDVETLTRGLETVARFGLPNYFDDQRFGAARAGRGFPARELCAGNAEGALRLLAATPSVFDAPQRYARLEELSRAWGDFARCRELARGWHEKRLFEHLTDHPGDFAGALRFVPRRERTIQLFAYQSRLWNAALDRLVRRRTDPARIVEIDAEEGPLAAWESLTEEARGAWESTRLPLPSHGTRVEDADARACLEEALAKDGLTFDRLRIERIRGMAFREAARACVLAPFEIELEGPAPDERNPGRFRCDVKMSLPKGAYATLVVKRAAAPRPGRGAPAVK